MLVPRVLTLLTVAAVLGAAGCGGSKDDKKGPQPSDAASIRNVLGDLQAAAVAADGKRMCTQIFTPKLADTVRRNDRRKSCPRAVRGSFSAQAKLAVSSVKVTDATHGSANVKDGDGHRATVLLVKQSGTWRISAISTTTKAA